jgi:hypothetical protein
MKLELLGFPEERLVPVRNSAGQLYLCRPAPGVAVSLYWLYGSYSLWFVKWGGDIALEALESSGISNTDKRCIASYHKIDSLVMASALIHHFIKTYQRSNVDADGRQDADDRRAALPART